MKKEEEKALELGLSIAELQSIVICHRTRISSGTQAHEARLVG